MSDFCKPMDCSLPGSSVCGILQARYMWVWVCVLVCVCMSLCVYVCMCVCISVCVCMYMYACVSGSTWVCVCVCARVRVFTHVRLPGRVYSLHTQCPVREAGHSRKLCCLNACPTCAVRIQEPEWVLIDARHDSSFQVVMSPPVKRCWGHVILVYMWAHWRLQTRAQPLLPPSAAASGLTSLHTPWPCISCPPGTSSLQDSLPQFPVTALECPVCSNHPVRAMRWCS